jgi:hypothetical protein
MKRMRRMKTNKMKERRDKMRWWCVVKEMTRTMRDHQTRRKMKLICHVTQE